MKRLWSVGLLLVASLIAQSQELASQPREWVRFDSRVGQFTMLLPQMPSEKIEIVASTGGPYTSHVFSVKANNTTFLVGWVDYNEKFKFGSQSELNANRDNFIKEIKAGEEFTFNLPIPSTQYLPKLVAHNLIKVFAMVQGKLEHLSLITNVLTL